MIYVESYSNLYNCPENSIVINTTSRSDNWSKGLSPFFLPGGQLYENYNSVNVENLWQGCKVYEQFVDENQNPTKEYFIWAEKLWNSEKAVRYPMGKGLTPLYSYWNGEKYDYITARKKIYIPVYERAAKDSEAYKILLDICLNTNKDVYLIDFDGYNHIKRNMKLTNILNNPNLKMGHAFVIYSMLIKDINKQTRLNLLNE